MSNRTGWLTLWAWVYYCSSHCPFHTTDVRVLTSLIGGAEVERWRDVGEQTGNQSWFLLSIIFRPQWHWLVDTEGKRAKTNTLVDIQTHRRSAIYTLLLKIKNFWWRMRCHRLHRWTGWPVLLNNHVWAGFGCPCGNQKRQRVKTIYLHLYACIGL